MISSTIRRIQDIVLLTTGGGGGGGASFNIITMIFKCFDYKDESEVKATGVEHAINH